MEGRPDPQVFSYLVSADLVVPLGWSYALQSYRLRGDTSLSEGAKAELIVSNSLEASEGSSPLTFSWVGPRDQGYAVGNIIPLSGLVWSPCGSNPRLRVNFEVRMSQAPGLVTLDSWDLKKSDVAWRRCF